LGPIGYGKTKIRKLNPPVIAGRKEAFENTIKMYGTKRE